MQTEGNIRLNWQSRWLVRSWTGFVSGFLLFSVSALPVLAELESKKPAAALIENVDTDYFGMKVSDPYQWMEKGVADKRFEDYLKSQNQYTRQVLNEIGPARDKLLERIRELDIAVPIIRFWQKVGDRIFYIETASDLNTSLMLKDEKGKNRCLLDPRTIGKHVSIDYFSPSYDGKYLVVGTSFGGSENSTISIIDVDKGETLPERITRTQYASPSWSSDSRSFYYARMQELAKDAPPSATYENERVFLHRLHDDPEKDPAVFGPGVSASINVPLAGFSGVMTESNCPYLIGFNSAGTIDSQNVYLARADHIDSGMGRDALSAPGKLEWKQILSKADKLATQSACNLSIHGTLAYMLLDKDAPNRRLVVLDLDHPDISKAVTVKAESDRVILGVYCASDALYVTSKKGVEFFLERMAYESDAKFENIILPYSAAISNVDASPRSAGVLFRLESWTESGQAFYYDPEKKQVINTGLVKKHTADFTGVESRELSVRSADGTMVPVSIVCPKGVVLDGSHPTIIVGYGAYGVSLDPNFDPATLSWIEKSGVIAFVHARGGGELGEAWHEAGQKAKKQHTIDDMLAAAQYLIESKYTSNSKLAIKGTSAGGIACGGAITQRPDLFAVAIDNVGMTDMLRFQNTQGGAANIPEFGDVTKQVDFASLFAMSAYHQIKDGAQYPAVMGITGVNDPRVPSWIIAKFIARLQTASASRRPVLLRADFDAGHGIASNRSQRQQQMSDERSFMLWQFGDPAFQIDDEFER